MARARANASYACLLIVAEGDAMAWARAQRGFAGARFVAPREDELHSMYLLSLARDLICGNSTFCWWAAFLARLRGAAGRAFFPRKWFKDQSSEKVLEGYAIQGAVVISPEEYAPEEA
jgi:hypothetical protein